MIYFDTTKAARAGHFSGLQRVCQRLRTELAVLLEDALVAVRWDGTRGAWTRPDGSPVELAADDWLLTAELFSEAERPGLSAWLSRPGCRLAAIYHDAIPLRFPKTTWPQSVARHPEYMKLVARFDRVLANSEASRAELEAYWRWGRMEPRAKVTAFPLGADGGGRPRARNRERPPGVPALLMVGILEPRKNQEFLLDVVEQLWAEGVALELHLVGRVNPHFGRTVERRVRALALAHPGLRYHGPLSDGDVAALADQATTAVFPSRAEGNGLPVIEALWSGLPCLCSDIPALGEHARGGGCLVFPVDDLVAWKEGIRRVVTDEHLVGELVRGALNRPLPTWRNSAEVLIKALE